MARRGARRIGLVCLGAAFCLVAAAFPAPEGDAAEPGVIEGYEWMGGVNDGTASFVYGSPETAEDLEFWLTCEPKTKETELVVYVDIEENKVGQAMPIEVSVGSAKAVVKGKIATDEMIGVHVVAKGFKVKPVVEVFKGTGTASLKTGDLTTLLPEKGRAKALAEFAKGCTLD
jgi:hypothetical protein